MAKPAKQTKKKGGPYLAAAFFCETTIEDKQDNSLSAIRIIDKMNLLMDPAVPSDCPSEKHPVSVSISGLLSFKTGDSPGEHTLRLVMHCPSSKPQPILEQTILFPPYPNGGANVRLDSVIKLHKGGLFWLHVFLDGKKVTRMPLQITVQRAEASVQ